MPSLGKHDPLKLESASKYDIDLARQRAESFVRVNGFPLQFDSLSRQRMKDVLAIDSMDDITWGMADNSTYTFTRAEFSDLIMAAESSIGIQTLKAFERAKQLKAKLDAGEFVSKADLRLECWTC